MNLTDIYSIPNVCHLHLSSPSLCSIPFPLLDSAGSVTEASFGQELLNTYQRVRKAGRWERSKSCLQQFSRSSVKMSHAAVKVLWILTFKKANIRMNTKQALPDLHLWRVCYQSVCTAAKNIPYNLVAARFLLHNPLSVKRNCFWSEAHQTKEQKT